MRATSLLLGLSLSICSPLFAAFSININYMSTFTDSQKAVIDKAARSWEAALVDYKAGITGLSGVTIYAASEYMDGSSGVLASASVRTTTTASAGKGGKKYTYALSGTMSFDRDDIVRLESQDRLFAVVQHEMAHALGFGTLWTSNGVYVNGSGQYTGADAVATYRKEFNQPTALFVPVELGGGAGSANSHWAESSGGGLTGLVDSSGRDMYREVMTAWLNTPSWKSLTTQASFSDLGYAIPEPSIIGLGIIVGVCMLSRRNRAAAIAE